MITKIIFAALLGAALGGVVGYAGKCSGGACPLTCNPLGGMIMGAIIGALMVSGRMTSDADHRISSNVIQIANARQMDELLSVGKPVLIDFYADWCGPCKLLKPTLNEVADEYIGKAAVATIDVDKNRDIAEKIGVSSVPDVRLFKDGRQVERIVGVRPKESYKSALDGALN